MGRVQTLGYLREGKEKKERRKGGREGGKEREREERKKERRKEGRKEGKKEGRKEEERKERKEGRKEGKAKRVGSFPAGSPTMVPKSLTFTLPALPLVARLAGALVGGGCVLTQGISMAVI
jgi:hypothetical protein